MFLYLLLASGCTGLKTSKENNEDVRSRSLRNTFAISQQKPPPQQIQSIQLYRKGSIKSAPIINLNSSEKLTLEFDYLGEGSKQFKVRVSHRNKSWEESPLAIDFYMSGFNETYFSGGLKSFSQRPSYFHYTYEFPNSQLRFKASGNYLLSIYDYDTNELLFSLPFLVSEDIGSLDTRIETLFARGQDLRAEDQPFSRYQYPDFVDFPQFDLSFVYVQNQFWGRSKPVNTFDTSSPEEVHFHLSREDAYLSNYEFNKLDLRNFSVDGQQILEIQQEEIPPKIILRHDVQAFQVNPSFIPDTRFGIPVDKRNATYANVQFSLETAEPIPSSENIYLVGDFNNWTINELNRMQFNPESGMWEGLAFIKEGEYIYKYVILKNGKIDDLSLDQGFRFRNQSYLTLVYYKDPTRNFDRLLKIERTKGN